MLSENIYVTERDGCIGHLHFSYGEYHDPLNTRFGVMEALNDFLVGSASGFDTHPHEEIEIISYCVDGELSHRDSLGNAETLRRGDVGYQCAGSGLVHAELNSSPDEQLRFVQVLILPNTPGLTPGYAYRRFAPRDRRNKWLNVASGRPKEGIVQIRQDADVFVSEVDGGRRLYFAVARGRQAYLVCLEGSVAISGLELGQGSSAKAVGDIELSIDAQVNAHLLLVEMAESA